MSGKHVSVVDKGEYLLVTCPPCHDADECIACIDGMNGALKLFGKSKVLADFTAAPEPIPIMAARVGARPAGRYAANRIKIAVVARQGVVNTDRFLENIVVAINRPVSATVFEEDFDAALAWLT